MTNEINKQQFYRCFSNINSFQHLTSWLRYTSVMLRYIKCHESSWTVPGARYDIPAGCLRTSKVGTRQSTGAGDKDAGGHVDCWRW